MLTDQRCARAHSLAEPATTLWASVAEEPVTRPELHDLMGCMLKCPCVHLRHGLCCGATYQKSSVKA